MLSLALSACISLDFILHPVYKPCQNIWTPFLFGSR